MSGVIRVKIEQATGKRQERQVRRFNNAEPGPF
jgi:hypothetical protein